MVTDAEMLGAVPLGLAELLAARQRLLVATASISPDSPFQQLHESGLVDKITESTFKLQQSRTFAAASLMYGGDGVRVLFDSTHLRTCGFFCFANATSITQLPPYLDFDRDKVHREFPADVVFPLADRDVLERHSAQQDKAVQALKKQGNDLFRQLAKGGEGSYRSAAKLYLQAAEICDDNALKSVILSNRAQCWLNSEQWSSALADASSALALDPTNKKAETRLATAKAKVEPEDKDAAKPKPSGRWQPREPTGREAEEWWAEEKQEEAAQAARQARKEKMEGQPAPKQPSFDELAAMIRQKAIDEPNGPAPGWRWGG